MRAQSGKATPAGEHTVGYRKPPMHSRFKKGKSGNPNGRPKGTVNFATVLLKTLRELDHTQALCSKKARLYKTFTVKEAIHIKSLHSAGSISRS